MGQFQEELDFARGPVFGEGETAGFLNQLNQLTEQAGSNITNRLAARGASRSGSAEDQLTNLELARGGQAADFFGSLPFREREARLKATTPLLNLGLGFAGRGVTNQLSTTDQTSDFDFTEQSQQESTSDTSVEGPGFLKSLAGAGGELLGGLLSQNPSDPFDFLRKKRGSRDSPSTSEIPLGQGKRGAFDLLSPLQF